jgi:cell division protein FtsW (lipid II flippase)
VTKYRYSPHFFIIMTAAIVAGLAHYSVYYGALLRGYEASSTAANRNVLLIVFLAFIPIVLKRLFKLQCSWTAYTAVALLFSIGLTVQYRLFSDPEYTSRRDKAEARQMKTKALQLRYIKENYSAEKKQFIGLPATPPEPADLSEETPRPSGETLEDTLTSGRTINPLLAVIGFFAAIYLMRRDDIVERLKQNGFLIVIITLFPLVVAAVWSSAGKFAGNLTPWELAKVPFLVGFAAVLAALYKDLSRTYWGLPRARDAMPLVFMALLPFFPFFILKDFGQMMVFSAVYVTLYLIAVRGLPQRLVLVGSMIFVIAILVVGALPAKTQEKIPLLPTLASPVRVILPDRIQQRFHLWLDGFNPPDPETSWWKRDHDSFVKRIVEKDVSIASMLESDPALRESLNVDAWFDMLAFQPAQATFGIASGGMTGRGLGLGHPELIPVADSDYIFAALAEELGVFGGAITILLIIIFAIAGLRIALDCRDMFSKLCAIGLTAFIGFQALVNVGGITRALPMTGITLPFVSHGGFSLITSFVMLGMLLALAHRNVVDLQKESIDVTV